MVAQVPAPDPGQATRVVVARQFMGEAKVALIHDKKKVKHARMVDERGQDLPLYRGGRSASCSGRCPGLEAGS